MIQGTVWKWQLLLAPRCSAQRCEAGECPSCLTKAGICRWPVALHSCLPDLVGKTVRNLGELCLILQCFLQYPWCLRYFWWRFWGHLRSRSPISVCLDLRPALWEGWGPWGLWSLLCPAELSWGLLDAASYAQSKVGTKPYCAPEVLSNLDYKNQALQAEAMVWKDMASSQLASKDVNA